MKRRHFLKAGVATAAAAGLAACGSASAEETEESSGKGAPKGCEITSADGPLVIRPGEGETTDADMVIKVPSNRMSGNFSIMEGEIGPRQLLAPHTHVHEDQIVYIIAGELEFEVGGEGGERFSAGAGSYVIKPRGILHGFWNARADTVRYIELSTRDGFEGYVYALGDVTLETAEAAGEEFDVYWDVERTIQLMKEHNLLSIRGAELELPDLPMP